MAERTHSAILSMHGDAHALATTRTRECVAMPGVRNQVVCSPQAVCTGLDALWLDGVEYDPCHGAGSIVGARRRTTTRGLIDPWPHRTYGNVPFGTSLLDPENEMEAYMEELRIRDEVKAQNKARAAEAKSEGRRAPKDLTPKFPPGLPVKKAGLWNWLAMQLNASMGESIVLCPNRTNRSWLRQWRKRVTALMELDPLAFIGSKDKAPFPLVLGFVGPESRIDDFHKAFSHLGDPA